MELQRPLNRVKLLISRCFILVCISTLLFNLGLASPVLASIHVYPETETTTMYRSKLSIQDEQGQAWQAILFKRIDAGQVIAFNLRLVGFPGQIEIQHPTDLQFRQGTQSWVAADRTATNPQLNQVTTTVGEYDVMSIMQELDSASRMEMILSLNRNDVRCLIVPKFMVKEWLTLKEQL